MAGSTRLIGVGRHDEGDRVAGLLVAHGVRRRTAEVDVRESSGDPAHLREQLRGAERLIVVESTRGAQPGCVHRYRVDADADLQRLQAVPELWERIGEVFASGELPRHLTVYMIEATRVSREAGVSPDIVSSVIRLTAEIVAEVEAPVDAPRR